MLKLFSLYILVITSFISFLSCNNAGKATTKKDEETFADFFKFKPTPDVKNFNYYADEVGIDASHWISFECNEQTFTRIKENLELQKEKNTQDGLIGGLNINPTTWWDTAIIQKVKPYSWQKENLYRYLWYDSSEQKVYFLAFDT